MANGRVASKYTLLASCGVALEYFDFIIFALLAPYLSLHFFGSRSTALLETFMVFALGYIARPLGGVLFGGFSDRYGRKSVLVASMAIMSVSTIIIGLLPSVSSIGVTATILLVICRVTQGLTHGAEMPLVLTYVSELQLANPSVVASLLYSSASIGALLAVWCCYLLEAYYGHEVITNWAWRLPFVLGGLLAAIGVMLRSTFKETPVFLASTTFSMKQILQATYRYWRLIFLGFVMTLPAATLVILGLFLPSLMTTYLNFSKQVAYELATYGMCYYAVLLPIFANVFHRYPAKLVYSAIVIFGIFIMPFGTFLLGNDYYQVLSYILILKTVLAGIGSVYPMLLANLFPVPLRNTALAASYNLAFSLAALLPATLLWNMQTIIDNYLLALILVVVFASSLIGIMFVRSE